MYDYNYNSSSKTPVEKRSYYLYVSSKLDMESKEYQKLSYSQILELVDCYQQDLQNRTIDDILTPNDTYCYIGDYIIFDSYENTINFLTSNNYNPPTISSDAYDYTTEYYYEDAKLYKPSNVTCGDGTYYTPLVVVNANSGKSLYDYNALMDLLGVAQPNYVTTEDCYMLQFGSNMYVIPPEYSELAESIYSGKYSSTSNSSSSSSKYLSYKAS
jgi:hypothetical protein